MKKPMSKLLLATAIAGSLMQANILLAQDGKPVGGSSGSCVYSGPDTKSIQDPATRQVVESIVKKLAAIKGYEAELQEPIIDPTPDGFSGWTSEQTVCLPDRMILKQKGVYIDDPKRTGNVITTVIDGTWKFQVVRQQTSPEEIKNYRQMVKQACLKGKPLNLKEIDKRVDETQRFLAQTSFSKTNLKAIELAGGPSVSEYIATQANPVTPFAPYKLETLKLAGETPSEWILLADQRTQDTDWPHHRLTFDKETGFLKEIAALLPETDNFVVFLTVKKVSPRSDLEDSLFQMKIPDKDSLDSFGEIDLTDMRIASIKAQRKAETEIKKNGLAASEKKKAGAAFFRICKIGTLEKAKAAIAAGAEVNVEDDSGAMPLVYAASNKNPEIVSALIAAGAKIDARNHRGSMTPLMVTVGRQGCNPEAITRLLKCGADVNATDNSGHTPLILAARSGSLEVVAALVKAGADVNVKTGDGTTPLMLAAIHNKPETIAALLKMGAEVNVMDKMSKTPLMMAAYCNQDPEVLKSLIKAGANVNAKDQWGNSILSYAKDNENQQIAEELIKAGAR